MLQRASRAIDLLRQAAYRLEHVGAGGEIFLGRSGNVGDAALNLGYGGIKGFPLVPFVIAARSSMSPLRLAASLPRPDACCAKLSTTRSRGFPDSLSVPCRTCGFALPNANIVSPFIVVDAS